jgi:hypothetical protein
VPNKNVILITLNKYIYITLLKIKTLKYYFCKNKKNKGSGGQFGEVARCQRHGPGVFRVLFFNILIYVFY